MPKSNVLVPAKKSANARLSNMISKGLFLDFLIRSHISMKFKDCVINPTEISTMDSMFNYALCKHHESSITVVERLLKFFAGNGNSLVLFSITFEFPLLKCLFIRSPKAFFHFTLVVFITTMTDKLFI